MVSAARKKILMQEKPNLPGTKQTTDLKEIASSRSKPVAGKGAIGSGTFI